jgi:hypothetical protein
MPFCPKTLCNTQRGVVGKVAADMSIPASSSSWKTARHPQQHYLAKDRVILNSVILERLILLRRLTSAMRVITAAAALLVILLSA